MSLIIHPEYENLKNILEELIFEYNELKFQICPNLEMRYVKNFGLLEYELYKKDVELSKIKRKLQLIQIKINNEEKIDIDEINNTLNEEFSRYEKSISKQREELEKMLNSYFEPLSNEDVKTLKALYKKCVFALHPDLNDELSQDQLFLFTQINEAFKNGDLKRLESLHHLIPQEQSQENHDFNRLHELIRYNEIKIKNLKENYPYNKKELLDDSIKIKTYKVELEDLIKQFDEKINYYQNKIISMI